MRLVVGGERRKLTGLVQTRAQETRNLLNDGLGREEVLVLLRELLDELLVLLLVFLFLLVMILKQKL